MIPCINQATVLPVDTIEFLALARESGFHLVELDIAKLEEAIQKYGLPKLQETKEKLGMQVISLNAIENYPIILREDMTASLSHCERIFKISSELDCSIVVLNPNEFQPGELEKTQQAFDSFVNQAAVSASNFNIRLGYEFVSYENRVDNTLASSLRAIERWRPGIGLVLDIFHLFRSGERTFGVPDRLFNRLWIFHVNDAPPIPISELKDSDRVFPGEGVIDVGGALKELSDRGFPGPVSVELFNSTYWKRPAQQVLGESWSRLHGLLMS